VNNQKRTGVFGGTFDPIHYGHIDAVKAARNALDLDTVLLVPTKANPHRSSLPIVSEFHRFAMVALAVVDHERLCASDIELVVPDLSFTAVTLERLAHAGAMPEEIFFITGADAFAEVATWHDYPNLLNRSHFVVVSRPNFPASYIREQLPDLASRMHAVSNNHTKTSSNTKPEIWLVDTKTRDISSSNIRHNILRGRSISGLVPPMVDAYIKRNNLYSSSNINSD